MKNFIKNVITLTTIAAAMVSCNNQANAKSDYSNPGIENAFFRNRYYGRGDSRWELRNFKITVQNVMAANMLSPFLANVQLNSGKLFQVGTPASPGIQAIAETGDRAALQAELSSHSNIQITQAAADGGPIPPGQTRSIVVSVPVRSLQNAFINVIAMIGMSNDSFISTDGIRLSDVSGVMTVAATNYDAGTEENTGNLADFGNGGHPVARAEGIISYDRGLNPRGNAPEKLGWGPTAALITIEPY